MSDFGKRKVDRYQLKVPAQITEWKQTDTKAVENSLYLTSTNVSSGGAFFKTAHQLQLGAEVEINLQLTINSPTRAIKRLSSVLVSGRVIRIENNGMAIQFGTKYKILPIEIEHKFK